MKLVEFRFRDNDKMREVSCEAAEHAFGLSSSVARKAYRDEVMIRCTAEQFGIFIAYRAERIKERLRHGEKGLCNRVSTLSPALIEEAPQLLDVSKK